MQDFSGTYGGQSQYDRMLTYALDTAQNRTVVTDSQAGQDTYVLEPNSNRYEQVQRTVGADEFLVYDGNGNVIADNTQVYVYDFLDRLSEVYRLEGGGGAQSQTGGTGTLGTQTTKTKKRKLTKTEIKNLVVAARAAKRAFERTTLRDGIPQKKAGSTTSSTGSASTSGGGTSQSQSGTLYGAYGYDPSFRRVWRSSIYEGTHWYVYDGWQVVEDCDALFTAQRVHFDGIGIDEHLGFAVKGQGSAWTSYAYVQDSQRSVVRVLDASGNIVEQYEYGPHGAVAIFDSQGAALSVSGVGNLYGHTGRRFDPESQLMSYRHRFYSIALGRFVTRDPLGVWADPANLGNQYAFVGGSAQWKRDPLGLFGDEEARRLLALEKRIEDLVGNELGAEVGFDLEAYLGRAGKRAAKYCFKPVGDWKLEEVKYLLGLSDADDVEKAKEQMEDECFLYSDKPEKKYAAFVGLLDEAIPLQPGDLKLASFGEWRQRDANRDNKRKGKFRFSLKAETELQWLIDPKNYEDLSFSMFAKRRAEGDEGGLFWGTGPIIGFALTWRVGGRGSLSISGESRYDDTAAMLTDPLNGESTLSVQFDWSF